MQVSFVIVTRNRRDALLRTLDELDANPAHDPLDCEVLVVDNASTDGSADAVAARRGSIGTRLLRRERNEGVSGRNHGIAAARGRFVVCIDDDSHPIGDAVARSVRHLESHPQTAAVVGRVVLPGGGAESPAFPEVMVTCAVCLRKAALDQVGLFPVEFFRQAEEYDLSFRLWNAGWRVERFEDVAYMHHKAPGNRPPAAVRRYDMRNNLILAHRYIPAPFADEYRRDWYDRYAALARHGGAPAAATLGWIQALVRRASESLRPPRTLSSPAFESLFHIESHIRAVDAFLRRHQPRRVVLADFGKNLYAAHHALAHAGVRPLAVLDNHPAYRGMSYRGAPILPDHAAASLAPDAIVLGTLSAAQVEPRIAELRAAFDVPILRLWRPQTTAPKVVARVA